MQNMKKKAHELARSSAVVAQAVPPNTLVFPASNKNGREVITRLQDKQTQKAPSNKPDPQWQDNFEKILVIQSGSKLRDLEVKKLHSFVWSVGGQNLNVESVLVSFKNEKNESTKFNALVDSQNGKIIQTWNQPVKDPGNPRENFGVKLDPRYNNE